MPDYTEHKLYNGEETILFDDSLDKNNKPKHAYWKLSTTNFKKDCSPKMERLTGVTTFLKIIDKPALINWAVRITLGFIREHIDKLAEDTDTVLSLAKDEANKQKDIAGEIGSAVHKWVEQHIKGENPEMPENDNVLIGVMSFIDWATKHKVNFVESERIVYSRTFNFIGTADFIIEIDGKKYLGDIKTGNDIYEEVLLQTAAYVQAYEEETGENIAGRVILRISKENKVEYEQRMKDKGKTNYPEYKNFQYLFIEGGSDQEEDFSCFLNTISLYRWKYKAYRKLVSLKENNNIDNQDEV